MTTQPRKRTPTLAELDEMSDRMLTDVIVANLPPDEIPSTAPTVAAQWARVSCARMWE